MITRFILKHHKGNVKGAVIECTIADLLVIRRGLEMVVKDPLAPKMDMMMATSMLKKEYEFVEVDEMNGLDRLLEDFRLLLDCDLCTIDDGCDYCQPSNEEEMKKFKECVKKHYGLVVEK